MSGLVSRTNVTTRGIGKDVAFAMMRKWLHFVREVVLAEPVALAAPTTPTVADAMVYDAEAAPHGARPPASSRKKQNVRNVKKNATQPAASSMPILGITNLSTAYTSIRCRSR